jgi:broad-specificity NMP kinase
MPLFLVTGLPGTGKSTIRDELKSRGYKAYDGDYDHLAKWYNNKTGQPIKEGHYHERTPEFLKTHSRDIARQVVEDLATKAKHRPVFLCGDPENEDELVNLFSKVFALVVDEGVRQNRLATRTNNEWGKLPHEIAYDQAVKPVALDRYKRYVYITLDASQPPKVIVDQILKEINSTVTSVTA